VTRASIFLRGLLIVTLTSTNVGQIAQQRYAGAFALGFVISFLWWENAKSASESHVTYARETYALGAACGVVLGIWLVQLLYGVQK
jgi:hypothetical protein